MARKVLGQGLRALIPEDSKLLEAPGAQEALVLVPLASVAPNPLQPRRRFDGARIEELAASIREQGMLQPVVVRRTPAGYEVVVGERRVRAARLAGLEAIPAVVREDLSDLDLLAVALVENIQREDLDPIEQAEAYRELMERGQLTQQQVAARVGKSREAVANTLRLLSLPREVQEMVADGRLTPGHARAILSVPPARQRELAILAASTPLTVRQTEARARAMLKKRTPRAPDPALEAMRGELEQLLAAKVKVECAGKKGRIVIHFQSSEELERILSLLRRARR